MKAGPQSAGSSRVATALRHRRDDLRRVRDPIPVARDRPEGVVHGGGRVAEVFDLLEDRIRQSIRERVTGEDQDGQAVGVGRARSRHHVERTGTDGRRGDHDLATASGLGEADGGQRHGLLVLTAPHGQPVLNRFERLREAGDVAVTENCERTGEERNPFIVDDRGLAAEVADQGLRHRQAHGNSWHRSALLGSAVGRTRASVHRRGTSAGNDRHCRVGEEERSTGRPSSASGGTVKRRSPTRMDALPCTSPLMPKEKAMTIASARSLTGFLRGDFGPAPVADREAGRA